MAQSFNSKQYQDRIKAFGASFEKDFGAGTLRRGKKVKDYGVISTGSVELDIQLGVGGYVEGRIVEIWGPPDMGKTTLSLLACVEAQAKYPNRMVAYIDAENKVDESWADKLGVDRNRWFLYVPLTAEDVSDAVKRFLDNPDIVLVVVDSIGALISKAEQAKDADEAVVANVAKIVTRMVKFATLGCPKHGAILVIVNQPRDNIARYGSPTTTPGGWALKMASTMKLQVRASDKQPVMATVKGDKIPIGREIAIKIERNKVHPPGQTVRPFLVNVPTERYGPVGINKGEETLNWAIKLGIVSRSGNRWVQPTTGETFGKKEDLQEHLLDHPDEVEALRDLCIKLNAPAEIEESEVDLDEQQGSDDDPVSDIDSEDLADDAEDSPIPDPQPVDNEVEELQPVHMEG